MKLFPKKFIANDKGRLSGKRRVFLSVMIVLLNLNQLLPLIALTWLRVCDSHVKDATLS